MLLLPLLYLPPLPYLALLATAGEAQLEAHESYLKSTWRNRCEIAGANGIIPLSIPLLGGRDHHRLYRDTQISYMENWQHRHWATIYSAYGSAPYYEHYRDKVEPMFHKHCDSLWEWNEAWLMLMIRLMKLDVVLTRTDSYERSPDSQTDLRTIWKPGKIPAQVKIGEEKWHILDVSYIKVFGPADVLATGLSSLDLLMNAGPESAAILRRMVVRERSGDR
ncbi:MAG: WbqC family protein [Bacteroidetes bacterium]|nr:WbqC family protein [Bacteroidota bacterium]